MERRLYKIAFNPNILAMHKANMDIQFILDAYACVSYIVNYINKSHRGVSRLLNEAMDEIRSGNFTVKQRLQHIGNKFISASEVSGQEASYNILGMHLSQCSSSEVYINTLHPDKRVRILKSRRELENIPGESTDVFQKNLLDHYIARPNDMQDYCLAHFAAYYKYSKSRPSRNRRHQEEEDDYNENNDFIDDNNDGNENYIKLRDGSGYIYKKESPAIIRFPTFNADQNRENYFRALVMLYMPWRNEKEDILDKITRNLQSS
ncbi:hypothetical protein CVS40_3158 [Lucilia cuprina]|nr:hypothetical protein CVS40_3158 [Lucilia cuprina]